MARGLALSWPAMSGAEPCTCKETDGEREKENRCVLAEHVVRVLEGMSVDLPGLQRRARSRKLAPPQPPPCTNAVSALRSKTVGPTTLRHNERGRTVSSSARRCRALVAGLTNEVEAEGGNPPSHTLAHEQQQAHSKQNSELTGS